MEALRQGRGKPKRNGGEEKGKPND